MIAARSIFGLDRHFGHNERDVATEAQSRERRRSRFSAILRASVALWPISGSIVAESMIKARFSYD
jgi:hypothetical protein